MQNHFYNSRSVIIDPIFKKSMENSYHHHKKKLQSIKNRKNDLQQEVHDEIIKRKLSHKISVGRITQQFDLSHNQKRSLVKHIAQIITRKPDSVSEYKRYKNKYQQNQKQQIKRQNKLLSQKIAESKSNKLTKKDLKKQFKQYQSQKNLLRKVHYETEKTKKKKEKSFDASRRQHN